MEVVRLGFGGLLYALMSARACTGQGAGLHWSARRLALVSAPPRTVSAPARTGQCIRGYLCVFVLALVSAPPRIGECAAARWSARRWCVPFGGRGVERTKRSKNEMD